MRTAINVVIILVVALGIGLFMRYQSGTEVTTSKDTGIAVDSPPVYEDEANGELTQVDRGDEWLTSFKLTERSGETISSESLKGQPYIASFFFSTCPSICKLQNEKLQQLQTEFKDQPIRFVAITVDPEIDTPEKLQEYAQRYKADEDQWLFLTGDLTYIRRVGAEMFQTHVEKQVHTERFFLVDANGNVVKYYTWSDPGQFDRLKEDIQKILDEKQGNA